MNHEQKQKINQWINSGEFNEDLSKAVSNIIKKATSSNNESETVAVFEQEIYYLIRTNTSIEIKFNKETTENGVVHSFHTKSTNSRGHGRLDAIVNSLIIEYKYKLNSKSQKQKDSAYEQLKGYLSSLYEKEGVKYDAILTDGISIAYFQFDGDEVKSSKLRTLSVEDAKIIINGILSDSTKKFEPVNIVKDFSVSPFYESESKKIANLLFEQLQKSSSEKTTMLYEEWKCLMHLSVDDNGKSDDINKRRNDLTELFGTIVNTTELEYKGLFALQTTYAIIVKLIACKIADNLSFNSQTVRYNDLTVLDISNLQRFFRIMEDGYSYSNMRVRNFLEGDYFSWYADEEGWTKSFFDAFKKIIIEIDDYSDPSLELSYKPIDIFKDLYMNIIPQSVRHSMGEYFTPEWLADWVVTTALSKIDCKEEWKAIDPCCGSGIFVLSLIRKIVGDRSPNELTEQQRKELIDQIITRVHGIDINPLSALSARVSYYIALRKLGEVREIDIPIYLGDSAIIPKKIRVDNIDCYSYTINNLKNEKLEVVLPIRMVKEKDFGLMMRELQTYIKAEKIEPLFNTIKEKFSREEQRSSELCKKTLSLCEALVELHKNKWDGIWVRIATNFMMIARLQDFDIIAGNPPWVKWEHLPSAYANKIKDFCDIQHIFCSDGGMFGGTQLNICALISNVTATNWLKKDGILAFLMPDSIMSQNSYEQFRCFYTNYEKNERLYLQMLDRWMAPLRPFKYGKKSVTQDFNTYYYGSCPIDYRKDGVKVRSIRKKDGFSDSEINKCLSYESVQKYLRVTESKAKQLSDKSTAFTYEFEEFDFTKIIGESSYEYRTGVESTPFEIFKLEGVNKSQTPEHYLFKNKSLKTSKYKVKDNPKEGWDFPTRLIYPMVESPNLKPFTYDTGNNFHIIPYEEANTKQPISLEKLIEKDKELAEYFINHKELIEEQSEKSKVMHRGDEFYSLSKIGPYTFAKHIVAARDNTYFCASVICPTKTPWGITKQPICVKHTIIISQDLNGNPISEDEAHYVNGILNSTIVHAYIHSTFKTNGFSLKKANLYIPKYNPKDTTHKNIMELSKEATCNPDKREENAKLLTIAYVTLCNKRGDKTID